MLNANQLPNSEIEAINDLFEQFSVSLENKNKFLRHSHIVSKPKLKQLLKLKSSPETPCPANVTVCSRCKKETLVGKGIGGDQNVGEKEVEVRKELSVKGGDKKVKFLAETEDTYSKGEIFEKADLKKDENIITDESELIKDPEPGETEKVDENGCDGETDQVHFQSVFFASRPSIIGNNEFWLPQYSAHDAENRGENEKLVRVSESGPADPETTTTTAVLSETATGQRHHSLMSELSSFINSILLTSSKKAVKVLQVVETLDNTLATLTDEHLFKCRKTGSGFEIVDVVALKEVRKIMVTDSNELLVLEVCHASTLTELKEFVPGCSEKTESLISLMVYALSRLQNVILDVTRLPFLKLPTCHRIAAWHERQKESILYIGIATAENICFPDGDELSEESFMMKISGLNQFHPILLLLRSGFLTSKCNGGCEWRGCKYSVNLELSKEKVRALRREDKPWPNCVRLITPSADVTFASSGKANADDLMDKVYSCIQPIKLRATSIKAFVIVTEQSLQMFSMTMEKLSVFGSPLLNLEIFDEEVDGMTCIIESQGVEVDDVHNLDRYNRWHLTFLNSTEKSTFLSAASII